MSQLLRDLRLSIRSLLRRPGLTCVLLLTASLGIGAATALFDLANLVAWLPIPGTEPDRMVQVWTRHPQPFVGRHGYLPPLDAETYVRESTSFEDVGLWEQQRTVGLEAATPGTARLEADVTAAFVNGAFFRTLGLTAHRGRLLGTADDQPAAPIAALLGHAFWQSRLDADPAVVGSEVLLDGQPAVIVGIAPADLVGVMVGDDMQLWLADAVGPRLFADYEPEPLLPATTFIGRLRPGVTAEQARDELQILGDELDRTAPLPAGIDREITVSPARYSHPIDRRNFRPILQMLGVAVALLLLLACANIANLLLGRSIERAPEISLRLALGAGRSRLVRQLLTEAAVIALSAGGLGLLLALAWRRVLPLWLPASFADQLRFDHRVLGASLVTCLAAALLFGLAPALLATRSAFVGNTRGGTGARGALRAFRWLAGLQLAIATLLLVCTSSIGASLRSLNRADLGFDDTGMLSASIDVGAAGYALDEGLSTMVRIEDAVAALPAVTSTSRSLFLPPVYLDVERQFRLPDDPESEHTARMNIIDDGYFRTLGLPVLAGRPFDSREREGPPTVILDRSLVDQLWPGSEPEDALDRVILLDPRRSTDPPAEHRVVGVVPSIRQHDLRSDGEPILYLPTDQRPWPAMGLIVRVEGDPEEFIPSFRSAVESVDPALADFWVRTSSQVRWDALVVQRLQGQSVAILATMGLLLSLIGIFGVLQLLVTRRRREIGVRMAVGADGGRISRWVFGHTASIAIAGILVGTAAAIAASDLLEARIEGFAGLEPGLMLLTDAFLLLAALAATTLPARRAARIEPLEVLRSD